MAVTPPEVFHPVALDMTCGHPSDLFTGMDALTIGLLAMFSVIFLLLLSVSWPRKTVSREAGRLGAPVTEPPPFAGPEHAAAVSHFANLQYYQSLLAALQDALLSEGYALTTDGSRCLPLPPDTAERVAREVACAREKHLLPLQPDDRREERLAEDRKNGYAARWLEWLIAGSAAQGWYITRRQGDPGVEATQVYRGGPAKRGNVR